MKKKISRLLKKVKRGRSRAGTAARRADYKLRFAPGRADILFPPSDMDTGTVALDGGLIVPIVGDRVLKLSRLHEDIVLDLGFLLPKSTKLMRLRAIHFPARCLPELQAALAQIT